MENKIYIASNGRKYIRCGTTLKVYWSQSDIDTLKRYFPTTSCAEIAKILNKGCDAVMDKARELGLKKDAEHRKRVNHATLKLANLHSRLYGNKGRFTKGSHKDTEYKPKYTLVRLDTGFIGTSREIAEQIGADQTNIVAAAKRKGTCNGIKIRFYDNNNLQL